MTPAQSWTNRYNGPGEGVDFPSALHADLSGNVYVTGSSANTPEQGWALEWNDFATIKYSAGGVPLWTNRFNGDLDQYDGGTAIAVDIEGNVVVTGFTKAGNGTDFATIKYSSSGVPVWTHSYDGPAGLNDTPTAIAVDGHGNLFVTGTTDGATDSSIEPPMEIPSDITTIMYSSGGVAMWTNRYDGPANLHDAAKAVVADREGNVIVVGSADATGPSVHLGSAIVAIKYSGDGVPVWTNRYEGDGPAGEACWPSALAVDPEGNVLIAGRSERGTQQGFVTIKYSAAGVPLWTRRATASGASAAWEPGEAVLAVDGQGNAFVVMGSPTAYLTVKYSVLGEGVWTNHFSRQPTGYSPLAAAAVDEEGNLFVAVVSNEIPRPSETLRQITRLHYSAGGQTLSTNRYDVPSIFLSPTMVVDRAGNVFVAGDSPADGGLPDYITFKYAAPPVPPRLEIQRNGDSINLKWPDPAFGLQSAPTIQGPFTNISGATSPYTTPAQGGAQRYFRLFSGQ
ncbi:MAG: SBBP repeat-containing protein [Limisphaerales bacterium]